VFDALAVYKIVEAADWPFKRCRFRLGGGRGGGDGVVVAADLTRAAPRERGTRYSRINWQYREEEHNSRRGPASGKIGQGPTATLAFTATAATWNL